MSKSDTQPANPLQLTHGLYEVFEGTIVASGLHSDTAFYRRVVYRDSGAQATDHMDLSPFDDIRDVAAFTDMHTARQRVFVLTGSGITEIAHDDNGAAVRTEHRLDTRGLTHLVNLNPISLTTPVLLVAGQSDDGAVVVAIDTVLGEVIHQAMLPGIAEPIAAARLVRQGLQAHIIVAVVASGTLRVYDCGHEILKGESPTRCVPLAVGPVTQAAPVVSLATATLVDGSPNQQIVVAYPSGDGARIAVLDFADVDDAAPDEARGLVRLAEHSLDVEFARPERPVFRLATANLLRDASDRDQIVVGYTGNYGETKGCACLTLIAYRASEKGSGGLVALSRYAAAVQDEDTPKDHQALASIDLHLAAGVFGADGELMSAEGNLNGTFGVALFGAAASLGDLAQGRARLRTAIVPVNTKHGTFPPLAADVPSVPSYLSEIGVIDAEAERFFAIPSDLSGLSVTLGAPTLSMRSDAQQILAIIRAIPFQDDPAIRVGTPTITLSRTHDEINGYNVSSNRMWMTTDDAGGSLGIGSLNLTGNINKNYGEGFDRTQDHSTTHSVTITADIDKTDILLTYGKNYFVWSYPIFRKSAQGFPDGELTVVFPTTAQPVQGMPPANLFEYGYRPRSEVGNLISYLDVEPDGYDETLLLFDKTRVSSSNNSGQSVTFDSSQINSDNTSRLFLVHNSANAGVHFNFSKTLFDFLPTSFGLNLSHGNSYSDTKVKTTMQSYTENMSITMNFGSVTSVEYDYEITPLIYQHKTMGCLMIDYQVALTGAGWKNYFKKPAPVLTALQPNNSVDPIHAAFSRSISFVPSTNGEVRISVEVANHSFNPARSIECTFYIGKPHLAASTDGGSGDLRVTPPSSEPFHTVTVETIGPLDRSTVTAEHKLADGDVVTVTVKERIAEEPSVYWAVYPPQMIASALAARDAEQAAGDRAADNVPPQRPALARRRFHHEDLAPPLRACPER